MPGYKAARSWRCTSSMIMVLRSSTSLARSVEVSFLISSRTPDGRADSMMSVVPMATASSMEWVTNRMVRPVSRQMRRTSCCMMRRAAPCPCPARAGRRARRARRRRLRRTGGTCDVRGSRGSSPLHLGQMLEGLRDLLGGVLVVLEPAGQIGLVGAQVEEAVAAQVEDDGLLLALLLALERLVDGAADRVRRLRRRQDALGARELDRRLERRDLGDGPRLDDPLVVELADERRHAVVAEAAGVHGGGHEGVAERVHLHQRREPDGVAEVVDVLPLGEARAGARLDG